MVFAIEAISYPANYGGFYKPATLADRIQHLKEMDAEWITLTTRIMTPNKQSSNLFTDDSSVSDADLRQAIDQAHDAGLKVMVKPHVRYTPWNGPVDPANNEQWFNNYQQYMVRYAKIAQQEGAEMYSLGNELTGVTDAANQGRWNKLINAVDSVYKGDLTIAAHYLNVDDAEFIYANSKVDVIGVNGYYPVAAKNDYNASYQEMKAAWSSTAHLNGPNPHYAARAVLDNKSVIKYFGELAAKYDKPVMFTEFGYASVDGTAINPGDINNNRRADQAEQANAFKAFFDAWAPHALPSDNTKQPVNQNKFFLGVHIWETNPGGHSDPRDHSYENKQAENVIKSYYKTDTSGAKTNSFTPISNSSDDNGGSSGGGTVGSVNTGGGDTGGANTDIVQVEARGTQAGGQFAQLQVLVDGVSQGIRTTTGTKKTYTFTVKELDNADTLEVRFPNDGVDGRGNDRNLIVTKVTADGETLDISDATYERDGKSDIGGQNGLWWNGELNFALDGVGSGGGGNTSGGKTGGGTSSGGDTGGANTDIVQVEARGTQAGGQFAQLQVLVDGVSQGIRTTTGTKKTYTFTVPELDNADTLELRFPNDGVDGRGNDRNLIITKVVADGQTLDISDATYERDSKSDIGGQNGLWWNGELNFDLDAVLG